MWTPRRGHVGAVFVAAALVLTAGAPPAAAERERLQYQFTLSAAPVEGYTYFFRELVQALGYSRVQLTQRRSEISGQSRAIGAALWPITDEEPCLLGCEPPCPESMVLNPTVARTSSPLECNDRFSGASAAGLPPLVADALSSGLAPEARASTPSDIEATGSSRVGDTSFGENDFASAGSVSTARVFGATGRLVASARSFLTDLRLPGGEVVSLSSSLQITAVPGALPTVGFTLSFASAGGGPNRSGVDQASFTISGNAIPIGDFVQAFNDSLAAVGGQLRVLAGLGIRVLAPTTEFTEVRSRFRVNAPVFTIGAEPGATLPTPTRDGGVRLASATFEGNYEAPDPALR
ncbi:MAG: hypothetical protein ACT4QG_19390 [Sporichthyaceae bacterium]